MLLFCLFFKIVHFLKRFQRRWRFVGISCKIFLGSVMRWHWTTQKWNISLTFIFFVCHQWVERVQALNECSFHYYFLKSEQNEFPFKQNLYFLPHWWYRKSLWLNGNDDRNLNFKCNTDQKRYEESHSKFSRDVGGLKRSTYPFKSHKERFDNSSKSGEYGLFEPNLILNGRSFSWKVREYKSLTENIWQIVFFKKMECIVENGTTFFLYS